LSDIRNESASLFLEGNVADGDDRVGTTQLNFVIARWILGSSRFGARTEEDGDDERCDSDRAFKDHGQHSLKLVYQRCITTASEHQKNKLRFGNGQH
jgi:hypothetical protein